MAPGLLSDDDGNQVTGLSVLLLSYYVTGVRIISCPT